jgi:hypothetical protein
MRVLSWIIVFIFFALVLSINTTRIDMTGGLEAFFDFTKWQDVTYWVQLVANTLFLVVLYAVIMVSRKNKGIEDSTEIEAERKTLFQNKDTIIAKNKRGQLDDYLDMVVNLDEKLDDRIYKIEMLRKRLIRFRFMGFVRAWILSIDDEVEKITKYRIALRSDISQIRDIGLNVHKIARLKKPVTFDSLFDIMDVSKPNRKVKIGYSDTAEAKKLIMRSPISSVITVFLSILAFGNVLIVNSDWKSVALIMGSVTVAALYKVYTAIKDAEIIVKNKRRSLAKANDEVQAFLSYNVADLKLLRDIIFKKEEVKVMVKEEKPILVPATKRDTRNWDELLVIQT